MIGDQRRWFRCAVPEGQAQALLRLGGRDTLIRIVNASAGGYALSVPRVLNIDVGDLFPMRTTSGWSEIRVVHAVTNEGETILGVERVRDLPDSFGRSWLDPVGGRVGAVCLVLALAAGVLVGVTQLGGGPPATSGATAKQP